MKKPKAPAPTTEELAMRRRQTEELARLDEEENRRVKGLSRMRLGSRSLLGGAVRQATPTASAPKSASSGMASGGAGRGIRGGGAVP